MSGKGRKPPKARSPVSASDRVGGPSTIRGINYQINFAILKALELVGRAKNLPHQRFSVALEPRLSGKTISAWDVRSSPPDVLTEVKLAPTRSDVLEWLRRIRETDYQGAFQLVCGKKRGGLLPDVEALARLAHEADGDSQRFRALVRAQEIENADEIFQALGPGHERLLRSIRVEELPEGTLRRGLDFFAGHLAGPRSGSLTGHLLKLFSEGGETRRAFDAHQLIEGIESQGITLYAPVETNLGFEREEVVRALFIVQCCPEPVPVEVVAAVVECETSQLIEILAPVEQALILFHEHEHLRMIPLSTQIAVTGYADLVARVLRALLIWVGARGDCLGSRQQIANVIALAKLCTVPRPEAVVGMFGRVQSILKAMGDKHVVLQAADLCLEAANRMDQDEDAARERALTLICGRSWVYQRIGRLQEAMVWAEKSLELGRRIFWHRNTAYCMKCIGRLRRMQSENASSESERKQLVGESIEKLKEAIILFERSDEHGPTHTDTGDCYSLLGRSYLASGDLHLADERVRKAFDILPAGNSKDYLDLKILAGDIELVGRRNPEAAEVHYTDVLSETVPDDHQRSEILARAHLQRGKARQLVGRTEGAQGDYQKARDMWTALDEPAWAAEAEWRYIRMTSLVPPGQIKMFEKERSARIRVRAFRLHEFRIAAAKPALANRARPSQSQIDQLLRHAGKEVSLEHEW